MHNLTGCELFVHLLSLLVCSLHPHFHYLQAPLFSLEVRGSSESYNSLWVPATYHLISVENTPRGLKGIKSLWGDTGAKFKSFF